MQMLYTRTVLGRFLLLLLFVPNMVSKQLLFLSTATTASAFVARQSTIRASSLKMSDKQEIEVVSQPDKEFLEKKGWVRQHGGQKRSERKSVHVLSVVQLLAESHITSISQASNSIQYLANNWICATSLTVEPATYPPHNVCLLVITEYSAGEHGGGEQNNTVRLQHVRQSIS